MNRQLRRANEKSDKKKEKEKTRRKRERRAAKTERTARKAEKSTDRSTEKSAVKPGETTSRTGRLAPIWVALTTALIVLKELFPALGGSDAAPLPPTTDLIFDTLYFVLLGYFACMLLLRRGMRQALTVTVVAGMVLALAVEGVKLALPELEPVWLSAALALPALLLGGWFGRFVYRKGV